MPIDKRILTVQKTKRVEETKRRLDSKFVLESVEADRGGGLLGSRCESSGGGDKGGKNGGLHGVRFD